MLCIFHTLFISMPTKCCLCFTDKKIEVICLRLCDLELTYGNGRTWSHFSLTLWRKGNFLLLLERQFWAKGQAHIRASGKVHGELSLVKNSVCLGKEAGRTEHSPPDVVCSGQTRARTVGEKSPPSAQKGGTWMVKSPGATTSTAETWGSFSLEVRVWRQTGRIF